MVPDAGPSPWRCETTRAADGGTWARVRRRTGFLPGFASLPSSHASEEEAPAHYGLQPCVLQVSQLDSWSHGPIPQPRMVC